MSSKISRGENFKIFLFSSALASILLLSGCGGSSSSKEETTITHNGYTYGIVTSPITGKEWLDRNLGAYEVCTTSRDDTTAAYADDDAYVADQQNCFGDYYQWGRNTDGHEKKDSTTISRGAIDITSVGVNFITYVMIHIHDWAFTDSDGALRSAQWSKTDGTSVCPIGFRVPTSDELYAETTQYSGTDDETTGAVRVVDRDSAFKNFLRFPASGYRNHNLGSLDHQGNEGFVWSSSAIGTNSWSLYDAGEDGAMRADGYSIRCIKDEPDTQAPVFTNASIVTVDKTQTSVLTVTTTDESTVTYSLSGTDASSFNINSSTGVITFETAPDFETEDSYSIIVTASDTSSNTQTQNITINIDISETGNITHNGYTYGIVTSPITGKKWLDRNLGAYEVCTKSLDDFANDDAYVSDQQNCFGDLYQWGRNADGHQEVIDDTTNTPNKTASFTTITRATSYSDVGHGDFITNYDYPYDWIENNTQDTNNIDDDGVLRSAQWSKIDGTSICPVGFRVPTSDELYAETTQYTGTNDETTGAVKVVDSYSAFKNFLRFPCSDYHNGLNGFLYNSGVEGSVWASSVDGNESRYFYFYPFGVGESESYRVHGRSVRCIKD